MQYGIGDVNLAHIMHHAEKSDPVSVLRRHPHGARHGTGQDLNPAHVLAGIVVLGLGRHGQHLDAATDRRIQIPGALLNENLEPDIELRQLQISLLEQGHQPSVFRNQFILTERIGHHGSQLAGSPWFLEIAEYP